jgi:hypothetical protein
MNCCGVLSPFYCLPTLSGLPKAMCPGLKKMYCAQRGVSFLELKQTGELVTATTHAGRPMTLGGTVQEGRLHLAGTVIRPGGNRSIGFDGVRTKYGFSVSGNTPMCR